MTDYRIPFAWRVCLVALLGAGGPAACSTPAEPETDVIELPLDAADLSPDTLAAVDDAAPDVENRPDARSADARAESGRDVYDAGPSVDAVGARDAAVDARPDVSGADAGGPDPRIAALRDPGRPSAPY